MAAGRGAGWRVLRVRSKVILSSVAALLDRYYAVCGAAQNSCNVGWGDAHPPTPPQTAVTPPKEVVGDATQGRQHQEEGCSSCCN